MGYINRSKAIMNKRLARFFSSGFIALFLPLVFIFILLFYRPAFAAGYDAYKADKDSNNDIHIIASGDVQILGNGDIGINILLEDSVDKSMMTIYPKNNDFTIETVNGDIYIASGARLFAADLNLIAGKDIYSHGSIIAIDTLTMRAGGDIRSFGELMAPMFIEQAASFKVGGRFEVDRSYIQNLDNAITYTSDTNISGTITDNTDIIVNPNITLTLTGDATLWADYDQNGTGAFTMNSGSAIVGGDYNLTIKSSQTSVLYSISGVAALTIIESQTDSDPIYTVEDNINVTDFILISGTFISDPTTHTFSASDNFSISGGAFSRFSGSGTALDPYLIYDIYGLQAMKCDLAAAYALANNIDAGATSNWNSGAGFDPVGDGSASFSGTFNGNSHTITGLYINRSAVNHVGLFGWALEAVISDAELLAVDITGRENSGGLVGWAQDTSITDCYTTGSVSGYRVIGGLVGFLWDSSVITDSYSAASVAGSSYSVGGLVGENRASAINGSYFTGSVTGSTDSIGGLVGVMANGGTISNSHYNVDNVLINGANYLTIGGIYSAQYNDWIADKTLNIADYSATLPYNSQTGYYEISDVNGIKDLLGFADSDNKFRLVADIDLSSEANLYLPYFGGQEFDGNNKTVSNININIAFGSEVGFFGYLASGEVKNLGVTMADITASDYVGGLVGYNCGTISNSYSTGSLTANDDWLGGLVGYNYGTISNSYSAANVTGTYYVGGLVGWNSHYGSISNCYATGSVSGSVKIVGGLVGINRTYASISNCYASGDVTAIKGDVGGLVGSNASTIQYSYSTGSVTTTSGNIGGLVGYDTGSGGYTANFWDTQTSGVSDGVGNVDPDPAGVSGKTTPQMMQQASFSGWDFTTPVWKIAEDETYPYLNWQKLISGTVYSDRGSTPISAAVNVTLIINGATIDTKSTQPHSGAAVSTYYLLAGTLFSSDAVLVYIDDNALDGNTVTIASAASDISGLNIYGNTVIARHENAGPIANSTFSTAKGSLSDADIIYSVAGNNLTLNSGMDFLIWQNATYTPGGDLTADDLLLQSNATYNGGGNSITAGTFYNSGDLQLQGDETISITTMDTDSGTVSYTGDGDGSADTYIIIDFGEFDYYNLTINSIDGATDIFKLAADVNINNDFNNTSGSFDVNQVNNYQMTVVGNWLNFGTFISRNGIVVMDGIGQTISGSTSFFNLTKSVVLSDILIFDNTAVQTITGNLALNGASNQFLSLRSDLDGNQWSIVLSQGAGQDLSYLDIKDSDASGGLELEAGITSINSGNNINWLFNTPPLATFDNDFSIWNSGDITINYNLVDVDEDILNISQTDSSGIEYSIDGSVWFDATDAGGDSEGLTNLSSSTALPGTDHTFIWDSVVDLPNTESSAVYLRIRPNDGLIDADNWVISDVFGIDNVAPFSIGAPAIGGITASSIEINKPSVVSEDGSGLSLWQIRRDGTAELGFNNISTTSIIDSSLTSNTQYIYDVQFKDNQDNISVYGTVVNVYTAANVPSLSSVDGDYDTTNGYHIDLDWSGDGSAYWVQYSIDGVVYYDPFEMIWQTDADYLFSRDKNGNGLSSDTQYYLKIKAKNGDGLETNYSDPIVASTPTTTGLVINSTTHTVNQWTNNSLVTFTASGAVDHYHYLWSQNQNDAPTDSDPEWDGMAVNLAATAQGDWYFNVLAHNSSNHSGGTDTFKIRYDSVAPTPDPAAWATIPTADSPSQISMVAESADDAGEGTVQVKFTEISNHLGASSSDWISGDFSFIDSELSENTQYNYTVQYRDGVGNVGVASSAFAYTLADTPTNLKANNVSQQSITITVDSFPNDTSALSGYYFANTTNNTNSGWIQVNSWQNSNLNCSTTYNYTVKYRNGDGIETTAIVLSKATIGCSPTPTAIIIPEIAASDQNKIGHFSLSINDNKQYTNRRQVILTISVQDATQMAISNFENFQSVSWETYQSKKNWILPSIDGEQTVYAKFRSLNGGVSDVAIASIILDTIPPEPPIIVYPIDNYIISADDKIIFIGTADVENWIDLELTASSSLLIKTTLISDRNGDWSYIPQLSLPDDHYQLRVQARDLADNRSGISLSNFNIQKVAPLEVKNMEKERSDSDIFKKGYKNKITHKTDTSDISKEAIPSRVSAIEPKYVPETSAALDISKSDQSSIEYPFKPRINNVAESLNFPPEAIVIRSDYGNLNLLTFFYKNSTDSDLKEASSRLCGLVGQTVKIFVKPSKAINVIYGQVLFNGATSQADQRRQNFYLIFLNFLKTDLALAKINDQSTVAAAFSGWKVDKFTYQDEDQDGVYEAKVLLPDIANSYIIRTSILYQDQTTKIVDVPLLVESQGYVYEKINGQELRIKSATVSLYWLNPETGEYQLWNGSVYNQQNPQITEKDGVYSFLTPDGDYYLTVRAKEYNLYRSEKFAVKDGEPINFNIQLNRNSNLQRSAEWIVGSIVLLIIISVILLLLNKKRIHTESGFKQ